ncbi:hypothetical protein F5877DRAFT_63474 [Lentinula edodes]|nr:hypothetical protein F5877DRAFT_63474 [Lentinula edodes]
MSVEGRASLSSSPYKICDIRVYCCANLNFDLEGKEKDLETCTKMKMCLSSIYTSGIYVLLLNVGCVLRNLLEGMLEIGVVVSSILFGILTMQIYFYHKNFSEDPPWIKLGLVSGIWFIELTHTVCIAHEVYFYSVLHFGDTSTFNGWPVSFAIAAICHGVVAVLAELVSNIVIGVEIATIARQSFISFRQKWQWLILAVLILRAALDVLISGTLVYYLTYHRNNAYKNTIAVIDKLILWTIDILRYTMSENTTRNWYCYEPQYTIIPENLCQEVLLPRELHILSQNAPPVFSNTLLAKNVLIYGIKFKLATSIAQYANDSSADVSRRYGMSSLRNLSDIHINGGMLFTLDTENGSRTTNAPGKQCFPRRLSSNEVREQTVIA